MFVLLAEDEKRISSIIESCLRKEGIIVDIGSEFDDLEFFIENSEASPCVIILDRLLNDRDSIELLPKLRTKRPHTGVLVLSAINSVGEKSLALDAGADDYMSKPFALTELVARVKALSRRTSRAPAPAHLKLSNVLLDTQSRWFQVEGKRVNLTNREFQLLKLFFQNPGRVFSKSHIYESVWEGNSEAETNVVEATINSLRRRFESIEAKIEIKNSRNLGYWLEA